MSTVEELISRVWHPEVRPLAQDAYRSYSIGTARSAIILTWVAVCADLFHKISHLAEDADPDAIDFLKKMDDARKDGLTPTAVKAMQEVERELLDKAEQLELIDPIGKRELERLKQDRHLCAHPSLRPLGEFYEPRVEYARAHLTVALDVLLIHTPSQGRKAIERFQAHVTDPSFTSTEKHLKHAYFDKVRLATRKRIVELSVKHALLELEAPGGIDKVVLADRMALCVVAFAGRDEALVLDALKKTVDRFRDLPAESLSRGFARLGHLGIFWDTLDDPTRERFGEVVSNIPIPDWDTPFSETHARVLSLLSFPTARAALPGLQETFNKARPRDRASIIAARPDEYYVQYIPGLLREAPGWRSAEYITQSAVIPCARFMRIDDLESALASWVENPQCRTAGGMLSLSVDLFDATARLRPASDSAWSKFITDVRMEEDATSPYRYAELEARLSN